MNSDAIALARTDVLFQILLAKCCGRRIKSSENGHTLIAYAWRGYLYFTESYQTPK